MTLTVVGALTVGVLPAALAVPPPEDRRTGVELVDLPEPEAADGEDGGAFTELTTAEIEQAPEYEPSRTTLPPGDEATTAVSGLAAGEMVQVGDLPVAVGAPDEASPEQAQALEGDWSVALADPADLVAADVGGPVFTVTPPDGATGEAVVALDYTEFTELYGADWADRLQFTQYPECFLTTPEDAACTEPTEVHTENVTQERDGDVVGDGRIDGTRRIEATVDVATLTDPTAAMATRTAARSDAPLATLAAAAPGASVFVAASSGSGSKGDFSATPLISAGSWSAVGSSGAFTYSYPLGTPSVPNGPSPSVSFGYNSQVVDGRTSATNNQASWVGDGWEYNPGSVTRTYRACRDDRTDGNNAERKTGDMCWGSSNATLTLGGATTELVRDDTTGRWETASGDGSRVELLTNTSFDNGDDNNEFWRVTTRDGMQYWFGRHRLPGWSEGDETTDSVLTVPVSGNQPGEPCYDADFARSFCSQAWRWNLDYVVDTHGNAMSLWWNQETNHYARNLQFKTPVAYDRAGYLTRIDYGQRADTLFDAEPLARVTFAVAERCYAEDGIACTEDNFTSGHFSRNRIWYDTPADLHCAASGKDCYVGAPTFWSRKRLSTVVTHTQRTSGSTTLTPVDRWTLQQSLPAERTDEGTALWLESVTRAGYGTDGETITLNPVTFLANTTPMPNRVREGPQDPNPTFDRLRIARIVGEYGGETVIDYATPTGPCATGSSFPAPEDNTGRCFPAHWHPDPDRADESLDWFNKYVVESVQEQPGVVGVPPVTTSYEYVGGGAWALNQAEFSKKKTRTYDQWRGYALVRTVTGADSSATYTGTERGMTEVRYFRGMDGDPLPGGGTRSVTVQDSAGDPIATDEQPYAGRVAEQMTYTAYGGTLLTRTVDHPTLRVLATRDRDGGVPDLHAYRVLTDRSFAESRASGTLPGDTRTTRTVRTQTTYDDTYGLPLRVEMSGDTGRTGDESCTVSSYVHNTERHLIGLLRQSLATAGPCAEADTAPAADWLGGTRAAYDGGAYGDAPLGGLPTATWAITGTGGGWAPSGTLGYDDYGRNTGTTDALGNPTSTTYVPATGQVHRITTTNAAGHTTTTTVDPGRGTALRETDANDRTSTYVYDALGRATQVWAAGQDADGPASAKLSYHAVPREPVHIVTSSLGDNGEYRDSVTFYDGLGRERQSQTPAVGDGRLITDVHYSANGTIQRTDNAYYASGDPQTVMYEVASDFQIPNATLYAYDGLGRTLSETPYEAAIAQPGKAVRYEYGYDHSSTINPSGAASQRTYDDALGRPVRVETYAGTVPDGRRAITYQYDERGNRTSMRDAEDNAWSWTYDARGRQLTATDPDTGTSTTTYDVLDRPVTSRDARGVTVWHGYDDLSRPTEQRIGDSDGLLLARSTYDTAPGGIGLPTSETRYTDGLPYTTSVTGYTADYQPTGTRVSLPASVAQEYGFSESYSYSYTYTRTGLGKSARLPAAGALPAEEVITRYNEDGLPVSTSGDVWYTADTSYSPYGEILRTVSGEHPNRFWSTSIYDESGGQLARTIVDREAIGDTTSVPGHRVASRDYTYDDAGNVTGIAERRDTVTEQQCFRYDAIGQLTQAWTSGATDCAVKADGSPASLSAGPASDGYWHNYSYDGIGNRTELIRHHLARSGDTTVNDPSRDSVTTSTYGRPDGSRPHTLTGTESEFSTDSGARFTENGAWIYDSAGNTVSRTDGGDSQTLAWTWDGRVEKVTGFGENGAGAWTGVGGRCLDLTGSDTDPGTALELWNCNGSSAQEFRIDASASGSDPATGALKILGMCAAPAGTGAAVVIATCTGAADQQWTATEDGHELRHVATGTCLTAPGASPSAGTPLVLAACGTSGAGQSWTPANETRYIYGASGERLLAVSGSEHTLYLGETTIATDASGAHAYSERYYSHPGAPTVMRHVKDGGRATVSAQVTDHQGTAYADVTLSGGSAVSFSRTDPFGVERSQATGWRSHRSFVGGGDDDSTGLVHLGAREYDPYTGRFLSADPVLDLADPIQMNGYLYSANNPVTFSDPSGLMWGDDITAPEGTEAWADQVEGITLTDVVLSTGWAVLGDFLGISDAVSCFGGGDKWACAGLIFDGLSLLVGIAKAPKIWRAINATLDAISAWRATQRIARQLRAALERARAADRDVEAMLDRVAERAAQAEETARQQAATRARQDAARNSGNGSQRAAADRSGPDEAPSRTGNRDGAGPRMGGGGRSRNADNGSTGGAAGESSCNSFVAGTLVLMADGSARPIEELGNGELVVATDPETGETSVEPVTAEITGEGTKNLVRITVDTDGDEGDRTASLTATDGHPFWLPEVGAWTDATDLNPGQWLRTSAGTRVQITAVTRYTTTATVHNLTVADLHTYHVLAGETPVLVHNCGGYFDGHDPSCTCEGQPGNDVTLKPAPAPAPPSASSAFTSHALQRLSQRGVSPEEAERVLGNQPFSYLHDDQWKTGYYDSGSKIFIAKTIDGNINTVMTNVDRAYINRLTGGR
ncbi:ricin-type beta-trefoil lectin domain protein [Streptomyces avicenniae]|uniref:ricin-type beta-trefoil lectin domain protein n=1 Tax=Streptomyces avicenniae TaxID=500153 RepID=UPI00069BAC97|nr:ricin-type beta-trefoil lectin domain protein [Streptomyces avicenniae]